MYIAIFFLKTQLLEKLHLPLNIEIFVFLFKGAVALFFK